MNVSSQHITRSARVVPFLKWAGGKRWLTRHLHSYLPETFDRYMEPFLGSGACFFHTIPHHAQLSDLNEELIGLYTVMRDSPGELHERLRRHALKHSASYYYETRGTLCTEQVDRAARMLYLNRTCWNGLYRVNREGVFNVPKGTKDAVILSSDDFHACAAVLRNARLLACDFEEALSSAGQGDFVFADPPYTVAHDNNGFVKYNDRIFSWSDQVRLRDALSAAVARGAKAAVTNAAHSSIVDLYSGRGKLHHLTRASVLAASPAHRSPASELLITMGYCPATRQES